MRSRVVVSKSLIRKGPTYGYSSDHYKRFCLGLDDRCPCCINMEWLKKSLSLKQQRDKQDNGHSKKGKENNEREDRFVFDVMIVPSSRKVRPLLTLKRTWNGHAEILNYGE